MRLILKIAAIFLIVILVLLAAFVIVKKSFEQAKPKEEKFGLKNETIQPLPTEGKVTPIDLSIQAKHLNCDIYKTICEAVLLGDIDNCKKISEYADIMNEVAKSSAKSSAIGTCEEAYLTHSFFLKLRDGECDQQLLDQILPRGASLQCSTKDSLMNTCLSIAKDEDSKAECRAFFQFDKNYCLNIKDLLRRDRCSIILGVNDCRIEDSNCRDYGMIFSVRPENGTVTV